jgi:hypothetical protein
MIEVFKERREGTEEAAWTARSNVNANKSNLHSVAMLRCEEEIRE